MDTWITELTPLSFLRRSAAVYPGGVAVVHGENTWTYREFAARVEQRARMLRAAGVRPEDRVAYLMPNVPEMLAAHFAVPLAGAVLVAINTRLAPEEVRYILDHSGATVLVVDSEYAATIAPIAGALETVRTIAVAADPLGPGHTVEVPGAIAFDDLLAGATRDQGELVWAVGDERSPISINYTSGTTGRPKGVVYTHRGAYLNSLGEIFHSAHNADSVYLWTLPMFHCNGWCTTWALVAAGGTQICLREVRGDKVWELIDRHRVTHLNGAPTVVTTIMEAERARRLDYQLVVTTAGAPPSPATILRMERMGFRIVHVYGLTETYGPYSVNVYQRAWDDLEPEERAALQARQGVGMLQAEQMRVVDKDMADVPADGRTMGEIVMRGNNVMKGYFEDPEGTEKAFAGGWFHTGDLGVMHPDGYVELRDRAKDVIISGGENISTVEVEHAVASHPDVLEVAVIGVPDPKWGERPKAFVVPRPGRNPTEADLLEHVRSRIARYKAPREVEIVPELPKTSTGKVQKYELREKEWSGEATRIRG
ncbi:fatty-acyl-CoA synthase [Thermocatellispora tengchongensis]|uniref:Fatty-acyl-CoA synthase n=2 Tax=Thermocatellispora tengchongensis TaxID=1073253 RepID=A0A840PCF0_9ACTN|nr:long-chain-fatty-acid--CoA ligase [Thermocatellispora tengchongensis]MBB5135603.1 fatty-acyl-CoA synthase [Thermocatellispora tengchongensis]